VKVLYRQCHNRRQHRVTNQRDSISGIRRIVFTLSAVCCLSKPNSVVLDLSHIHRVDVMQNFLEVYSIIWNTRFWRARLGKGYSVTLFFRDEHSRTVTVRIESKAQFPSSTTHRLLKVMMSHRLIQQDHMTKLYRLGPGIAYLASVAKEGLSIRKIGLPIMHLRDVTGENTALHELRDGKRVCIEKVESKEVLRDTILGGDQFPAHAGATGKVLLAHIPREELKKYLNSPKLLKRLSLGQLPIQKSYYRN
jgi:transcriptional regulator